MSIDLNVNQGYKHYVVGDQRFPCFYIFYSQQCLPLLLSSPLGGTLTHYVCLIRLFVYVFACVCVFGCLFMCVLFRIRSLYAVVMTMSVWKLSSSACSMNSLMPSPCNMPTSQTRPSTKLRPSVSFYQHAHRQTLQDNDDHKIKLSIIYELYMRTDVCRVCSIKWIPAVFAVAFQVWTALAIRVRSILCKLRTTSVNTHLYGCRKSILSHSDCGLAPGDARLWIQSCTDGGTNMWKAGACRMWAFLLSTIRADMSGQTALA